MALTRKFLSALGIEADKIDEIIEAHVETINALKTERDDYKKDAEELPNVKKELETMKAAAENNDNDSWKVKYDALKEEYDDYKTGINEKETRASKESAYKQLLKDAGVSEKRIDSVLKVSKIDDVELDETGKIKDAEALTESIKTEWADFIVTTQQQGAQTSNPPANNATKAYTADDIKKMSTKEINDNWEAIQASLKNN